MMVFSHSMICTTRGIQRTAPMQWRGYDAMCGVYWQAEGKAGAGGYYRSPDPRVMLFFNDVSDHIGMSDRDMKDDPRLQPLLRAAFVPAGMPMWTRFRADHCFSHLDLHLKQSWLIERLASSLGASVAVSLLMQPRQLQDVASVATIGEALRQEVCGAPRHPVVAESLAVALVAALVEPPHAPARHETPSGGLTPAQMKRLARMIDDDPGRRRLNADLADAVGFSPSWFAHAFKKTTGKSPLQWQQERRIGFVKRALLSENAMIAEVASQFGFADQAHFTRVFRQVTGTTPAVWLREVRSRQARPPV